jgi:UDP-N-acetylglucosamine 2-epimerase (non-hydrolysing)/UDP-GlcNAc3NAcA epimerase
MTGEMMIRLEEVMLAEKPDIVLLYGDTNSTLAAALTAVKLHISIGHVEAGNRLGVLSNPEEINRICTDHVSNLLMCCTQSAFDFLVREGLESRAVLVGDPMYDAFLYYGERLPSNVFADIVDLDNQVVKIPQEYYYLTCHREENTLSNEPLIEVLNAMQSLDAQTVYPVHPRNAKTVQQLCKTNTFNNIIFIKPVGYLSSIALIKGSKKIVTDSGGVQREAFFAMKQCVTVFDYVVWPETMVNNTNQLALADSDDILEKLSKTAKWDSSYQPFGDGNAGEMIVKVMGRVM